MADCEFLEKCPFFQDKMAHMPSMSELIKSHFCKEDNRNCALYRVMKALGPGAIPPDLLPTDKESAERVIAAG